MSALSIHPIEYLKLHLHVDFGVIGKRLLATFVSVSKKVFDLAERVTTVAVVLLTTGLIVFAFMRIVEAALVTTSFNNVITEMVVPLLRSLPLGM